ncbi:zinc ribbon domain-containing protein [bacterium]|nr:zinc ribbon domain-containing protein [bacterium]
MPIYEYRAKDQKKACEHCLGSFEATQRMNDAPLCTCPVCGGPVVRVISQFSVSAVPSTRSLLSDKSIKRHGFTKLVNEGDGKFRKI